MSGFLRLNKALYGLRQSSKLWYEEIDGFLRSTGVFRRSETDPNLYISDDVLILLYLDDMLVIYAVKSSDKAKDVKKRLMHQYKMTDLGPAKRFLGLEIG